ncbi:MAG: hypothetical protein ACJAYF_001805 [Arenicella sp.]|jgi:hypothetical protein
MILTKKTSSILLLISAFICIGIYYFKFDNSSVEKEASVTQTKDDHKNNKIDPSVISVKSNSTPSTPVDISEDIPKLKKYNEEWCLSADLTQEAKNVADIEYEAWAISRNHLIGDRASQVENFKYYDEKVLKALGEQGNFIALTAIVDNDKSSDDMKRWAALKAGAYGGTGDAVSYFSIVNKGLSKALMRSGEKEEAKKAFLESVAWDEFLALRGDISLLENVAFVLSFEGMKELKVTKEDEKWISQRAREIYSDLSKERASLGLAPFDNSVPKVVEVDNAKMVAFTMEQYELSNKWLSKYYPTSDCVKRKRS